MNRAVSRSHLSEMSIWKTALLYCQTDRSEPRSLDPGSSSRWTS